MMRSVSGRLFLAVSAMSILVLLFTAQKPEIKRESSYLYHPQATEPAQTLFNINNITGWIQYNGISGLNPLTEEAGVLYPRGTAGVVWIDGFIWGVIVHQTHFGDTLSHPIRVGGSTYSTGLVPGWIAVAGDSMNPPLAVDRNDPRVRIYRIRRDWQSLTINDAAVIRDAAELNNVDESQVTTAMAQAVIDQYVIDWQEWPGDLGAPFYDHNGDGQWEGGIDEPGMANADQVVWFVCNDTDWGFTASFHGSPPIGLELQVTMWGYDKEGPLGQINFRRYRIINKSGFSVDSVYLAQFSDTDLGDYTDDLAGCDSVLDIGFCYNGFSTDNDYEAYHLPPPAVGYALLQGPIRPSPGNTAIFDNRFKQDFKNLRMTSFYYDASGNTYSYPTLGEYEGTLEWYRILKGFIPVDGSPFFHGSGPQKWHPTKFPLNGDPVSGTGDLDGKENNLPPGSRQIALCSGGFTMQPGDTQEVVNALAGGIGINQISSVDVMKFNLRIARYYHNTLFRIPSVVPSPSLKTSSLDGKISLDWGSNPEVTQIVESLDSASDFRFEGYNIYQLPNGESDLRNAVRIKTYDTETPPSIILGEKYDPQSGLVLEVPLAFGSNSGIQRYSIIEKDYFTDHPLIDGKTYVFAVTAYRYSPNPENPVPVMESQPAIVEVIAHGGNPGYNAQIGEVLTVNHVGTSTGTVKAVVINPGLVTGHEYKITFNEDTLWSLFDATLNQPKIVDHELTLNSGDQPTIDGILLSVEGSLTSGLKGWSSKGERWITGANWGGAEFFGGLDIGKNFFGSSLGEDDLVTVQLVFQDSTDVNANGFISEGWTYRRDLNYPFSGIGKAPWAAYDITDPDNPRRLNICFVEDANEGNDNLLWDMGWNGSAFAVSGGREYMFILNSDYDPDPNHAVYSTKSVANNAGEFDVLYAIWPAGRGSRGYLGTPFTMTIECNRKLTPDDIFTFSAPPPPNVPDHFRLYQNYPNPFNTGTTIRYWIPARGKVKLQIYNVLGQRVATLVDQVQGQGEYFVQWDAGGVASGMYIYRLSTAGTDRVRKMLLIK